MPGKAFNLVRERWICVMRSDGNVEELSMIEVFQRAPQLHRLAGELPTQDVALLRVLLAVLHAVFGRYDLDGTFAPPSSADNAMARWKALWDRGEFPMGLIECYLKTFEDRFNLFDPVRPFFQVSGIGRATKYGAAKLNGELSESSNKIRLFPQRTGDGKKKISYPEAARWLIYVNGYDDTSAKPKEKGLPSPGAGWLGKLGLIIVVGDNLFETLMLNLVLAKDGCHLWGKERPVWEADMVRSAERTEIPLPDNLSELYTLQSRRLLLQRDSDAVIGYTLLGGDFFHKANALVEQMTAWQMDVRKYPPERLPRRHDPACQLWRDYSVFFAQDPGQPGVVKWLAVLHREGLFNRSAICLQTAGVKYGDNDFFVNDVFSDSLLVDIRLIAASGESWNHRIMDEIGDTELLVEKVGSLAQNLARAAGEQEGGKRKKMVKELAYYRLDLPFRTWLAAIDPAVTRPDVACEKWWTLAVRIVRNLGAELMAHSSVKAFIGRAVQESRVIRYTAPEAYNWFLFRTSCREALKWGKHNG